MGESSWFHSQTTSATGLKRSAQLRFGQPTGNARRLRRTLWHEKRFDQAADLS
jgi:hypothetical protein